MNLIVEFGLMAAFSLGNTPWAKKDFQAPYLLVQKSFYENLYFESYNSSRTNAKRVDTMDPKTMLWEVSLGYKIKLEKGLLDVKFGHQSEHEVGISDRLTESYNLVKASYRVEY